MWLCLSLSYFMIARSDEIFACSSGVAHLAHCLTRKDVAFVFWSTCTGDMPTRWRLMSEGRREIRIRLEK